MATEFGLDAYSYSFQPTRGFSVLENQKLAKEKDEQLEVFKEFFLEMHPETEDFCGFFDT